jgi:hypothetical protein
MRMSNTLMTRLEGIGEVPDVSGRVIIAGVSYPYRGGVLNYQGQIYAVSDDKDFIISAAHMPIGAIVQGTLVPLSALNATQAAYFKQKYGYTA